MAGHFLGHVERAGVSPQTTFMGFALRSTRSGGGLVAAASGELHRRYAANSCAARVRQMQTRRIAGIGQANQGGFGAAPAELKLCELQKINNHTL